MCSIWTCPSGIIVAESDAFFSCFFFYKFLKKISKSSESFEILYFHIRNIIYRTHLCKFYSMRVFVYLDADNRKHVVFIMWLTNKSHNFKKGQKIATKLMLFFLFPLVSGLPMYLCTMGCLSTFQTSEWTSTWRRWSSGWWRCLREPSPCSHWTAPARSLS